MFVTGCHRSGTSLLASVLSQFVGVASDHTDQMKPALDNPRGFHESNRLVSFNDSLLARLGCSWDQPPLLPPVWDQDPFLDHLTGQRKRFQDLALEDAWVAKDPRLCLTYPAYVHVLLRRIPLLAAIREPLAVAGSLFARNGFPVNAGLCIWFLYNHHLASSLAADEPVIAYQRLVQAGDNETVSAELYSSICVWLEKNGIQPGDYKLWNDVLQQRISPNLDRAGDVLSSSVLAKVSPVLLETCILAFNSCIMNGADGSALQHSFSSIPRVILEMQQCYGICPSTDPYEFLRLRQLVDNSHQERNRLESRLRSLEGELKAMRSSTSWRITAPIRHLILNIRA